MAAFPFFSFCSALLAISLGIFVQFNAKQSKPYMDEIFHVPQAQKYCHYKFQDWDPKITTLPGIYLFSFLCLRALSYFLGQELHLLCSTFLLRMTNVLFLMGNVWILRQLLICIHSHCDKKSAQEQEEGTEGGNEDESQITRCSVTALVLGVFPVLYFFTFLYYTDSGSVFFVLLTYYLSLRGNHFAAALAGSASIFLRQTNVIWVIFTAGVTALRTIQQSMDKTALGDSPGFLVELKAYCIIFCKHFFELFKCLWSYGLVVVGFAGFVVWNGGIVVGDKSQHKACLNFPQVFYLSFFTLAFSSPLLLLPQDILSYIRRLISILRKPLLFIALLLVTTSIMTFTVYKFTYVHEYLLADNRHYPFYVWRKVYARHQLVKYLMIPAYMFAGFCIHEKLTLKQHRLWVIIFYTCVAIVTVPQKLLEFRYFIIPYIFYRLHVPLVSYVRLLTECVLYVAVNAFTIYLFLEKPFSWSHSPEEVQRFMW
ncbi:unnamed protein product [Porites evermanni]|uniref:Dol-P-Glc:Glc(2)Man(9)GlcNAc(2)-PP-Dol alpha-1,2-glucosyltransferase n=1 Tax=Porites evermanni TaxID=104178 RepID=A0ABN8M615_9CNID|nr:unnamed protein product [Porites evermanni]